MHVAPPRAPTPAGLAPFARLMPELSYYTVVSIIALGVDLAIFNSLVFANTRATLAGVIGYTAGMIVHYVLSARYVFDTKNSDKGEVRRFTEFALSGAVGLAITWALIHIATEVAHLPAMAGKIAAIATSFIVVFLLRRGIVFAARSKAAEPHLKPAE